MEFLVDVTEKVIFEIDLAYTVMGEIMNYFGSTDESSRKQIPNHADAIYNLLIIVNNYLYDDRESLQKAVDIWYRGKRE